MQELICPKCNAKLGVMIKENSALFDMWKIDYEDKNSTLDTIHALNDCVVKEVTRALKTKSLKDLQEALSHTQALVMLIHKDLPQGVQEAMYDQRHELIYKINKKIAELSRGGKHAKHRLGKAKAR